MLLAWQPAQPAYGDLAEAEAFYDARKWDDAAAEFKNVYPKLEGEQAAVVLYRIAQALRFKNDYEQAVDYYDKAIAHPDLQPKYRGASLTGKGYCLYLLKKYDQALATLDHAINLQGASANTVHDAAMYSGFIHNKRGEAGPAIEKFQIAVDLEGNNPVSASDAQLVIGDVLRNEKRYDEARQAYLKARDIVPGNQRFEAKVQTRLQGLDALLLEDTAFYMRPFVTKVRGDQALISWVSKGKVDAASPPKVTLKPSPKNLKVDHEVAEIEEGGFMLHKARLSGLSKDVDYQYTVSDGSEAQTGSFHSQMSADNNEPFEFVVIGDTQTNAIVHAKVAKNIAKHDPAFVVHCGDCVEAGNRWLQWQSQLIGPGEPYLLSTTLWPTRGNHDGGPFFPQIFDVGRTQHYSFDYGNVHVAVLDSFGPNSSRAGRKQQADWLKRDLAETDATWKFIATHDPMMTSVSTLKWWGEEDLLPVVQTSGVDFVMAGHHHTYRRFLPLQFGDHKPVFHVTTGGAGGGTGGAYVSPLTVRNLPVHHHTHFKVHGNRLEMTAVDIEGNQIDHLVLVKDGERYQTDVMASAVRYEVARPIAQLMYNMLKPRTDNVVPVEFLSAPKAGEKVKFAIDLAALASGGVTAEQFPPETEFVIRQSPQSPWKVARQAVPLTDGRLIFEATVPEKFGLSGSVMNPNLQVQATARVDGRDLAWQDIIMVMK